MAFRRRVPFRLAAVTVLLACSVQRSFSAFHCHDADMNGDGVPELVPTNLTIQVEESRDRISTPPSQFGVRSTSMQDRAHGLNVAGVRSHSGNRLDLDVNGRHSKLPASQMRRDEHGQRTGCRVFVHQDVSLVG